MAGAGTFPQVAHLFESTGLERLHKYKLTPYEGVLHANVAWFVVDLGRIIIGLG